MLLAALRAEAEAELLRIDSEARLEAARIVEGARARARSRHEARAAEREAVLRESGAAALAAARRAGWRTRLESRDRLLNRVFAAARDMARSGAPGAAEADAADTERLLREALRFVPDDSSVVVRCAPAAAAALEAALAGRPTARVAPDEAADAGVRVESADGAVMVDNTIGARIDRMRPVLAVELLARLEPAGETREAADARGLE